MMMVQKWPNGKYISTYVCIRIKLATEYSIVQDIANYMSTFIFICAMLEYASKFGVHIQL